MLHARATLDGRVPEELEGISSDNIRFAVFLYSFSRYVAIFGMSGTVFVILKGLLPT